MVYEVSPNWTADKLVLKESEVLELFDEEVREACIDSAIDSHKRIKYSKAKIEKNEG